MAEYPLLKQSIPSAPITVYPSTIQGLLDDISNYLYFDDKINFKTYIKSLATPPPSTQIFGLLGDSGESGLLSYTQAVANGIQSFNPNWVIHLGDANYDGAPEVTTNFLSYWASYNYANNMYLAFGNHDLDYDYGATLLSNLTAVASAIGASKIAQKLYCYDFVRGPVHFFVFNSGNTASGDTLNSGSDPFIQLADQINDLTPKIQNSTARWKIVVVHKPPYTSETVHRLGAIPMRLDYASLGVHAVISAHSHNYEYIVNDSVPYFVQGLGGATKRCAIDPRVSGAVFDFCDQWAYTMVTVTDDLLLFKTYDIDGDVRHVVSLAHPSPLSTPTSPPTPISQTYENMWFNLSSDGRPTSIEGYANPVWKSFEACQRGDMILTPANLAITSPWGSPGQTYNVITYTSSGFFTTPYVVPAAPAAPVGFQYKTFVGSY